MANTRDIQQRIKSIKNTRKVTKAMEVVSAAKMKKAIRSVLALRPYSKMALQILTNLTEGFNRQEHDLLKVREVKNVLVVMVSANKGLCGSFNTQIIKKVREEMLSLDNISIQRVESKNENNTKERDKSHYDDVSIDFITIGKKGSKAVKRMGKEIIATFPDLNYDPDSQSIGPLVKMIIDSYRDEKYDRVVIAYTDYVNAVSQIQKMRQLLPLSKSDLKKHLSEMSSEDDSTLTDENYEYTAEPSVGEVLNSILPRLIEVQILHAILESNASKESSRMVAMKNATDAAGDIIGDLTLMYNKLRQAKITQEISEISAGTAALE